MLLYPPGEEPLWETTCGPRGLRGGSDLSKDTSGCNEQVKLIFAYPVPAQERLWRRILSGRSRMILTGEGV